MFTVEYTFAEDCELKPVSRVIAPSSRNMPINSSAIEHEYTVNNNEKKYFLSTIVAILSSTILTLLLRRQKAAQMPVRQFLPTYPGVRMIRTKIAAVWKWKNFPGLDLAEAEAILETLENAITIHFSTSKTDPDKHVVNTKSRRRSWRIGKLFANFKTSVKKRFLLACVGGDYYGRPRYSEAGILLFAKLSTAK
ncbi:conserved hypothetical protein [Trichinella spiralis]|uniref:hypothetical protein n=1 Tax=Trichinella spiralis TaxID=6334 RepID=UPI0001EFEC3A|nr:conserved hypothetical protein [Trichinella spiralis]